MSDRYGELVQSSLGKKVAKNLGLPMPIKLDRFEIGQPILCGEVVLAGTGDVSSSVHTYLTELDAKITTETTLDERLSDDNARFKVAIFDATGLKNSDDLTQLYDFFHKIARRIKSSGRTIIIARPECCTGTDIGFAIAQRSVVGFAKSLAKEFKKGITANVLYTQVGAEAQLPSALAFFMSSKSAYVSGQTVKITKSDDIELINPKKPLTGKTILVTGASRGIGEATARVLARDGAKVVCLDVPTATDLQKVADEIGGVALPLDITAKDAGEQIHKACGTLYGVVHNAGITRDKTIANMSTEQWQSVMDINLTSVLNINQYLLDNQALSDDAHIVCVSSISAIAGNIGQTNYAASKAGVIGLVEATAKSFENTKRKINAVAPGFIETKMTASMPFAIREAGRRMNAMSQGGEPVDVAETISWLLSPQGGINGQIVRVCGLSLLGA